MTTQSTIKLYPSAPLEKDDLEQRLEKKSMILTVSITISITLKNDRLLQR